MMEYRRSCLEIRLTTNIQNGRGLGAGGESRSVPKARPVRLPYSAHRRAWLVRQRRVYVVQVGGVCLPRGTLGGTWVG